MLITSINKTVIYFIGLDRTLQFFVATNFVDIYIYNTKKGFLSSINISFAGEKTFMMKTIILPSIGVCYVMA